MAWEKMSLEEMDQAASVAEAELSRLTDEQIAVVSIWWSKNYMKAGHKRLGRILARNGKRLAQVPEMQELYDASGI